MRRSTPGATGTLKVLPQALEVKQGDHDELHRASSGMPRRLKVLEGPETSGAAMITRPPAEGAAFTCWQLLG
jgi:hypothetical protein